MNKCNKIMVAKWASDYFDNKILPKEWLGYYKQVSKEFDMIAKCHLKDLDYETEMLKNNINQVFGG